MEQKTQSERQLHNRLTAARLTPALAHLPAFGLMAPYGWNYHDPELIAKAQKILKREKIKGEVYETAPALFWYRINDGDIHCHVWRKR